MIGLLFSQTTTKQKNKKQNKQYGIIRQIKLRYAAKAMNGTKVPQEKLTTSLKRSHLLQLQVVYNLLRSL
jgi:hypothetical protein